MSSSVCPSKSAPGLWVIGISFCVVILSLWVVRIKPGTVAPASVRAGFIEEGDEGSADCGAKVGEV
jgi:hypothetical protein